MIRKSGYRFFLATNAGGVCAEIMLKQKDRTPLLHHPRAHKKRWMARIWVLAPNYFKYKMIADQAFHPENEGRWTCQTAFRSLFRALARRGMLMIFRGAIFARCR